MATDQDQLVSELSKFATDSKIEVSQLQYVLNRIDPSGGWGQVSHETLLAAFAGEGGWIPVENLVSKYGLQKKIADLTQQLDALQKISRTGGVGFPEAIADNVNQPGLQGLLIKVNHVSRICEDAEKSRAFYMDLLGATKLNRPNFPNPGYWLWLGNVQLHLIQGAHAKTEAAHAEGIPTGNVNHYSFEVYDFDAVEAKLKKVKHPYKKNRVPEGGSVIHQLFLQDPDGHYVEICDCNKFSDFVFGPPPEPKDAKALADGYNEGIDPTGASVAAVAALAFLPGEMKAGSQEELEDSCGMLQRAFKILSHGDNYIESRDLNTALQRMGHHVSDQDMEVFINEVDNDKSGHICFPEFVKFMAPRLKPDHSNEELQEAFQAIDTDGSGCINSDELLLMLWGIGQRVNEEELVDAIKRADKDNTGTVSFPEFLSLFEHLHKGVGS
mmetsp:Transcript_32653/g.74030  ORF Transcript_32653/g.74030 Transcript_32653/m.74030 type:complete len:441 (-) Transcript_32653:100-1422(-)|eukprot:CAMPEP_0197889036 /NCGR_PEP_ID=MMETSP1439-20131203/23182_1 /TAXON_ID=66791 /ORGANISM="Gonyaulax spinifera, Strain CCMP409" /LENGTH=440 /DNA_ID=CAMNT_0043508983 /DNA_START=70 /DNA_END=1392 /DNA_ORIENTATION=-